MDRARCRRIASRMLAAALAVALAFPWSVSVASSGATPASGTADTGQAASRAPLRFALPIRCTPGEDCFVQNHFDTDPGSGWRDYACGHLSYDGHKGTDFRVRSLADMRRGVEVLAAAPGVVVGARDGEPDISVRERGRDKLRGRDAGNGVRIDHGDGWVTQYSHLRKGSVRVRSGQRVREGDVLGLVGLSGNTEFPHVDFVIRKDGRALDPYAPTQRPPAYAAPGCASGPAANTLWRDGVAELLRYRATDVLIAGFAPEEASRAKAQRGEYDDAFDAASPALVFFVESFGARHGDREHIEVIGPDGRPILERERVIDKNLAAYFAYAGRRLRGARWPQGEYVGRYRLMRDDAVVAQAQRRITLR